MEKKNFSLTAFIARHKRDFILVLSLFLISITALLITLSLREEGGEVRIEIDGKHYATYPLSADGEYTLGDGNILAIENGKAYMKWADCPDKTCTKSHPVSYSGESIICLPHKLTVRVLSVRSDVDLEA